MKTLIQLPGENIWEQSAFIRPVDPQPENETEILFCNEETVLVIKNIKENYFYHIKKPYQIGDIISVKIPWQKDFDPLNDDMGILQPAETCPEKYWKKIKITGIDIKRVQDIKFKTIHELIGLIGENLSCNSVREYFNSIFSKPVPVYENLECIRHGSTECGGGGTAIKEYISYIYDKDSIMSLVDYSVKNYYDFSINFDGKNCKYKDRHLKIITNGFFYIVSYELIT